MLLVVLKKYILLSSILYVSLFIMKKSLEGIKPIAEFYKVRSVLYGVKNWDSVTLKFVYTEIACLIESLSIVLFYMIMSLAINIGGIIEVFTLFIIYITIVIPVRIKTVLIYTNYPSSLFLLNMIFYIFMLLISFLVLFISEIHFT